ncbi:DUF1758 domain-containing protein [Trichonephila clavipes]|nr:DUF1758 domain-containing protein [Trichonephila clavipes]
MCSRLPPILVTTARLKTCNVYPDIGAHGARVEMRRDRQDGNKTIVKSELNVTIINGNGSFSTTLDFLVVSKITDFLPVSQINLNNLKIPQELADPNFGVRGKIDLLIGAETFFDIIKEGIIRTSDNGLVFRRSVFGYIATGSTHSYKQNQYCGFISEMQNINDNLQKFWEIETINEDQKPLSKEEEYCENHYQMTHMHNEAGRYVVYMHSVKEDGTTITKLISSKSRVAPIKVISIPRLELSACLLLAQFVEKIRLSLQVHLAKVILHTDSTIAIAWINTPANQLKTFVGNQVSKIQTLTENFEWKHIPSAQYPAYRGRLLGELS